MKYVWRLSPVSIYDIGCYESWLSDKSAQGLFFRSEKKGRMRLQELTRFEKGEPERRCYRLEPARSDAACPPVEEQELYEEMGWRFVGSLRELFWVFEASERVEIPEPHTDPAALGELYERVGGKLKPWKLIAAWSPCIIMVLLNIFYIPGDPRLSLLTGTSIYYAGLLLYLLAHNFILFRHHFLPMRRLRGQLACGKAIDHNAPYRRGARAYLLQNAAVLAFALLLIGSEFYVIAAQHREELFVAEKLPVPLISELVNGFAYDETEWFNGRPYPNFVDYEWSILTPGQQRVFQHGTAGGESCALDTRYYQVRFQPLAEPLFEAALKGLLEDQHLYVLYEEVTLRWLHEWERAGFDEAVLVRYGKTEVLTARRGRAVLFAEYDGLGELAAWLPQFLAALG